MNIGTIKPDQNGVLTGTIATLAVSLDITLQAVENPNPRAPKYDVLALSAEQAWIKVGALFELFSSSTGDAFLNGPIDDPSFEKPMQVSAFRQADGGYNIVWSRPKRRSTVSTSVPSGHDEASVMANQCSSGSISGSDDGLGVSTAPEAVGR